MIFVVSTIYNQSIVMTIASTQKQQIFQRSIHVIRAIFLRELNNILNISLVTLDELEVFVQFRIQAGQFVEVAEHGVLVVQQLSDEERRKTDVNHNTFVHSLGYNSSWDIENGFDNGLKSHKQFLVFSDQYIMVMRVIRQLKYIESRQQPKIFQKFPKN